MTADFTKPTVASPYTDFPAEIREMFEALAKLFDGAAALNTPAGAKRFDDATKMLQKYNGTTWVDALLKAADSAKLNGQDAAYYRNAGNLNAGTVPLARLSSATETAKGIVELATNAEAAAGTDTTRAVTPANIKPLLEAKVATAEVSELATGSTIAKRNASGDLTCRYLGSNYINMSHAPYVRNADTVFFSSPDDYIRKNTKAGFLTSLGLNYATQAEAEAGTVSDKVMSPLRVAQAIEASGGGFTNGIFEGTNEAAGDIYDALSPFVPNIGDTVVAMGVVSSGTTNTYGMNIHGFYRIFANRIVIFGSFVSSTTQSSSKWLMGAGTTFVDEDSTANMAICKIYW